MPIDDLTALGQIMRKTRKEKDLTQQELFRPKPCFCKANRQYRKGKNESFLFDFKSIGKGPAHLFICRQRDRSTGSFIGYTGSISVPVVFRYDNSFYSKMIQQELAAKHSYNGHSMAENCKSTWHCVQENLPEKAKSISANFYLLVNNRSPIFQHIIVRNTVRC